ncbi:MAG: TolC family protein [Candidatus Gastranaerophilaceae bacterium]
MKKLVSSLLCAIFILSSVICTDWFVHPAQAAHVVKIAFVLDGKSPANDYFLKNFKASIQKTMDKGTTVQFPSNLVFVGDWTENGVKYQCNRALQSNATTVVALGYLSSKYMSGLKNKRKMVVTVDQYGLRDFGTGFFSPVSQFTQKLELFHRLTQFKKVAVMMNENYYRTRKDWNSFISSKLTDKSIKLVVVPVGSSVDTAMAKIPQDVDAALILPQFTLTMAQVGDMFNKMNARKIKTFSVLGESDVNVGCMLGSGALDLDRKISNAMSFNIKSVLDGKKIAPEKIMFYEDDILYVNADTCEKVGYEPPLRLLNNAKVISHKPVPKYTLSAIFNKLDEQNLDIEQKSYLVKAARKAAWVARLKYLPTASVTLGYQQYNDSYAESAALLIPEKTGVFGFEVDQVIYSPALVTNILIKNKKVKFEKAEYKITEQNMGINIANLYIDTLILRNQIGIQQEYVKEARENLAIARVREKMGYCGKEEVMRWASQLSISEQKLLDMTADYKNVKIAISKFLNEKQNQNFELAELKANDPAFYTSELNILDYVRTPSALEKFTQMLVDESFNVAPELIKLRTAMAMKKNERSMYIQKFILPDAKISYQYQNLIGRQYGSDIAGPIPGKTYLGSYPSGTLSGYTLTSLPLNAMHSESSYHRLGIFAKWTPIEGGQKIAEIQRINAELKQLETQETAIKTTLEEHIRQVVNKALSCYFSIEKDYKAMFAAKENYENVKVQYLHNKVGIAQMLDAEATYFNSKTAAANAQNEFFKQLVWVQRGLCSVNWTKAEPSAKDWIKKVKTDLVALPDVRL